MIDLQRAGGIAALTQALAYIVGFAVLTTVLNPGDAETWSAAQRLDFVLARKQAFQGWMIFLYVIFGIALVVLATALHERLKASSGVMQVATAFGLIWAGLVIASGMVASVGLDSLTALHAEDAERAVSVWLTIGIVQRGLGGGIEIVGGLWVLLISLVALRDGKLPRALGWLGLLVGAAGIVTIVPGFGDLGAVFGLSQIPWFIGLGWVLLRRPSAEGLSPPSLSGDTV